MRIVKCKRCGREWCFRGEGEPLRCGKCKSPYWNEDRSVTALEVREIVKSIQSVNQVLPKNGEVAIPVHPGSLLRTHDPKTCRLYGCLMCKTSGFKDARRGLA